jgi:telomere length regulation protein
VLFSILTILTVNSNNRRRVAEENAKELLETREWVQIVLERGGGAVEEKARMLGAGVLVEVEEVVKASWQGTIMADLGGFL